ncbi:6396_t:CDS:2, partial [Paraglomus brasilianum]
STTILADEELRKMEEEAIDEEHDDEHNNKVSEGNAEDKSIPEDKPCKLSPCVIVDRASGKLAHCESELLSHLIGTWEIDMDIEEQTRFSLHEFGFCSSHFNFDNSKLHKPGLKKDSNRSMSMSMIHWQQCLFCNKYKHFFSRGASMPETSSSPPSLFATKVAMRLRNLDFERLSKEVKSQLPPLSSLSSPPDLSALVVANSHRTDAVEVQLSNALNMEVKMSKEGQTIENGQPAKLNIGNRD